jgi:prepilin-type N-terminal cleavage/methylation domain-containing protein
LKASGRSGFSLVEIAVVISVASVVLLGVFATFNVSDRARNMANERDLAREACRAKLEELAELGAVNFAGLPALHDTFFDVPETPSPTGERLISSVAGELPGKILVSDSPAPARANLLRVTVQVRYMSRDNQATFLEASTLVASGR